MRVADVCFHAVEHLLHLDVRAAVQGTLQRADPCRNSGIGVGSGGGQHTRGKGGGVSTAVLGVDDEAQIQQMRLLRRVALVGAQDAQEILRRGQPVARIMQVQRFVEEGVAVDSVCLPRNDGQARHQLHGLPHHIFQ